MVRPILGVVVGYVVMSVVVVAGFLVGPLALGVDRVLTPGTYEASGLWVGIAMVISLAAALAGGAVCRLIARTPKSAYAIAAVVVVFGVFGLVMYKPAPSPAPVRPPEQTMEELMAGIQEHAREPLVTVVTNPIMGVLGVLGGSWAVGRNAGRRRE